MITEEIYKRKIFLFIFVALLIFLCYLSFLFAPFYFDDFYNIVYNNSLNSVKNALHCKLGGFRPFAYLSFYIDKKLFGFNPFFFRLENIVIHIFVFLLVFNVLKKLTKELGEEQSFWVSFFAASFWGLNPVNSQSVAYIVQRMNEVATLFVLLGFLFYLDFFETRKIAYLVPVFASLFLAVGFKETGILLIPLCLLHYTFFGDFKRGLLFFVVFVVSAFLAALFLPQFDRVLPLDYLMGQPVNDKHFTIVEKFLTSFKVLIDYIIVYLFPLFKNVHLYYDTALEKSLFSLSVIVPLLVILGLVSFALYLYKKDRVVSFSLLAFFLLLFPENSFLPLDIAYQHRMYLPSVFLSLAIAILLFKNLQRKTFTVVFASVCFFLAINLVVRGVVFSIPEKFYANEVYHAPDNEKIYINASKNLLEKGNLNEAYFYLDKGIKKFPENPLLAMNTGLFYAKKGEIDSAIYWYKKAEKKDNPFLLEVYWSLAVLYVEKKDVKNAENYINLLKKENYSEKKIKILEKKLNKLYSAERGLD